MTDRELIQELRDKAAVEGHGSIRRLLELAARALERVLKEQEPVTPRWTHPTVDKNVMMCGSCGIEIPLGKPNYCPWCGRRVKWDG